MKFERQLPVPYIDLDEKALGELATHVDELSVQARQAVETEVRGYMIKLSSESDPQFADRINASVETREYSWKPQYAVTMQNGSLEHSVWGELWNRANYPDIRIISMSARLIGGAARVRLSTSGFAGSDVTVESEDKGQFDREIGFFTTFFENHAAGVRRRVRFDWWFGYLLWAFLPAGAVMAVGLKILSLLSHPTPGEASASPLSIALAWLLLTIFGSILAGIWMYDFGGKISPRVLVVGVGPLAWLRPHAVSFAVGIAASSTVALLAAVFLPH